MIGDVHPNVTAKHKGDIKKVDKLLNIATVNRQDLSKILLYATNNGHQEIENLDATKDHLKTNV